MSSLELTKAPSSIVLLTLIIPLVILGTLSPGPLTPFAVPVTAAAISCTPAGRGTKSQFLG